MKIVGDDYTLVPAVENSFGNCWDLYVKLPRIDKSSGRTRNELKVIAYGITMEYALQKIINYRISKEVDEIELVDYLEQYNKAITRLEKDIRKKLKTSKNEIEEENK